jgi:FkbM family methyltransferase
MSLPAGLRKAIQSGALHLGYRVEKTVEYGEAGMSVFDLAVSWLVPLAQDLFFVQIGANDGCSDDPLHGYVTRHHWRGLLAEPQPAAFAQLQANYATEEQLEFANVAVGAVDGEATLYVDAGTPGACGSSLIASFDREVLLKSVGSAERIRQIQVPVLTPASLLRQHAVSRVDLLVIDTEGYDYEILKVWDFRVFRPIMIVLEHLNLGPADRAECWRLLTREGYGLLKDGINTIACLKSALNGS